MQEIYDKYGDRKKNNPDYKFYIYTVQNLQPSRDEHKKLVQKCGMKNGVVTEKIYD